MSNAGLGAGTVVAAALAADVLWGPTTSLLVVALAALAVFAVVLVDIVWAGVKAAAKQYGEVQAKRYRDREGEG